MKPKQSNKRNEYNKHLVIELGSQYMNNENLKETKYYNNLLNSFSRCYIIK